MRVTRIDVIPVSIPLTAPVRMATHAITEASNVLVRMESDSGVVGWGEAAEAHNMTGDLRQGIAEAATRLAAQYAGADPRRLRSLATAADRAIFANSSAKAGLDVAAHDLVARSLGIPLHDLVGGAVRDTLPALFVAGGDDSAATGRAAAAAKEAGYTQFKLKVGMADLRSDAAAVVAVREAVGESALVGVDANQSLTVDAAIRFARMVGDAGLDYLEQPLWGVDADGLTAIRQAIHVNLSVDEGLHGLHDIVAYARARAIDGMALKLVKMGGIGRMMAALELADLFGLDVNLSGKIAETSVGSAALAHIAAAAPAVRWGFSVTNNHLVHDPVTVPLAVKGGVVAVPQGPGLGIEVDEEAVRRFLAGEAWVVRA